MSEKDFTNPSSIQQLVLYRMSKVLALGGSMVTRICEGQYGITRREWSVLAVLAKVEKMSWQDLAGHSELDSARLSRAVTSLVDKKLASKAHLGGRQLRIALTDAGRELHAQLFPITKQVNLDLLQDLDEEALAGLDMALKILHARAESLLKETTLPKSARRLGRRR